MWSEAPWTHSDWQNISRWLRTLSVRSYSALEEPWPKDKGTNARDIHVTTKDGVVMLDGTVGSTAEKELAAQDAKKVKGVVDVHNGLSVK